MFLIPDDFWCVKQTEKKGLGVFAKKNIHAGIVIGDYIGQVINMREYDLSHDDQGLYLMYYTDLASIYPDLTKPGVHLLNHSCESNCFIYTFHRHTLFFSLREILQGEELTISYLLSPNDGTCTPCTHVCRCGSKKCTGTMHLPIEKFKLWQKFQRKQSRKTTTAPFHIGQSLPLLPSYPDAIPYSPIYSLINSE